MGSWMVLHIHRSGQRHLHSTAPVTLCSTCTGPAGLLGMQTCSPWNPWSVQAQVDPMQLRCVGKQELLKIPLRFALLLRYPHLFKDQQEHPVRADSFHSFVRERWIQFFFLRQLSLAHLSHRTCHSSEVAHISLSSLALHKQSFTTQVAYSYWNTSFLLLENKGNSAWDNSCVHSSFAGYWHKNAVTKSTSSKATFSNKSFSAKPVHVQSSCSHS